MNVFLAILMTLNEPDNDLLDLLRPGIKELISSLYFTEVQRSRDFLRMYFIIIMALDAIFQPFKGFVIIHVG